MSTSIEICEIIVNSLSTLIFMAKRAQKLEEHYPSSNADSMDDAIKFAKARAEVLTRLRAEFEDEMAKPN